MKLKLDKVIFINLLFRVFLLVYLLKEEKLEKPRNGKTVKHWLDPISKRVVLIFANGLERNFLIQNSTPYLQELLDNYGAFGVALTGYLQTNHGGIRAVLTGKQVPFFPFAWMNPHCMDTLMDYVTFSCGMGNLPMELSWRCYYPDEYPLASFQKFPGLFEMKRWKSSLYIMSFDMDPIYLHDYRDKLRKLDDDIRFFATMVDNFYGDNLTTYILTSARGSPVGKDLSTDAPVLAWGRGIAPNKHLTLLKQVDLTALLCALLGINFPSGLFALIPMSMMALEDHYEFDLTLYTIRHFERALELVDPKDHLYDTSELETEQLSTRLRHTVLEIRRKRLLSWNLGCCALVFLLVVWGVNLVSFASAGFACFFWHLKSLFLLLVVVGCTLHQSLLGLELLVAMELMLFCTWQNSKQILEAFQKHTAVILKSLLRTFAAVTAVGFIGNQISVPVMLAAVVLWPLFDGSYSRLNRYVLFSHLLSGIALGALPLNRVFGESPERAIMASVSLLFLLNFYFLVSIFGRQFDLYMKLNSAVALATTAHVFFLTHYTLPLLRDLLSCTLLAFSLLSPYFASGTLLEKLFKTLLSLFVPVLMLTTRYEGVFYFSVFFHTFSWIFTEYHSANPVQYQFYPAVFSVEPRRPAKPAHFSDEDSRHLAFFIIYSYVSYLAVGHFPDLHSYDLYVLPNYVLHYPPPVSYFLAGFKFFLPFFVLTAAFLTLCAVKGKSFKPLLLAAVCLSDLIGAFLVVYSQLANRLFRKAFFPAKFPFFVIQQFATLSVIFSYFLAKYWLLSSDRLLLRLFRRRNVAPQHFIDKT